MSTGGKEPEMGKVLIKLAERVRNDKIEAGTFEQALTAIYELGLQCIGADDVIYGIGTGSDEKRGANLLRASQRKAWAKACGVAEK